MKKIALLFSLILTYGSAKAQGPDAPNVLSSVDDVDLTVVGRYVKQPQLKVMIDKAEKKEIIKGRILHFEDRNILVLQKSSGQEMKNDIYQKINRAAQDLDSSQNWDERIGEWVKDGLAIIMTDEVVDGGNFLNKDNSYLQVKDNTILNDQSNHRTFNIGGDDKGGLAEFDFNRDHVNSINGNIVAVGPEVLATFFYQRSLHQNPLDGVTEDPNDTYSGSQNIAAFVLRLLADGVVAGATSIAQDGDMQIAGSQNLGQTMLVILHPLLTVDRQMTNALQKTKLKNTFSSVELKLIRQEVGEHYLDSDTNDWLYSDTALGLDVVFNFK